MPLDPVAVPLTLVSHILCPYVQRAVIALTEKAVPYRRIDISLSDKPEWFNVLSPLGKVPLLQVGAGTDAAVIFESAVILEYLEETQPNPLHPADPLARARHRGWIEFASAQLAGIARLYSAADQAGFDREHAALQSGFQRLEAELAKRTGGPWFAGNVFTLVDATFGPVFRYLDLFEAVAGLHLTLGLPHIAGWRTALASRPSVAGAVDPAYGRLLHETLAAKDSILGQRLRQAA